MAVKVRVLLDADWLQDAKPNHFRLSKKVYDPPFPFPFLSLLSAALIASLSKDHLFLIPFFLFNWKLITLQSPPPPSRPHFDIPAPYLTRDPSMLNRVQAL